MKATEKDNAADGPMLFLPHDRLSLREGVAVGLFCVALLIATVAFGAPSGTWLGLSFGLFLLGSGLLLGAKKGRLSGIAGYGLFSLGVMGLLQVIPLPTGLWSAVAPRTASLTLNAKGAFAQVISVAPAESFQGALLLIVGGMGLWAVGSLTPKGRELMRWGILASVFLVLTWAGFQSMGFYTEGMELRRASRNFVLPMGPFLNRDHAASYVLLAMPLTGSILLGRGVIRRSIAIVGTMGALFLMWASDSRGVILGLMGGLWALALCTALLQRKTKRIVSALLLVPMGILGAPLLLNLVSNATGKVAGLGLRGGIWRDSLSLFLEQPLFGWGLGSFQRVIPLAWTTQGGFFPAHAHSELMELIVEQGIVGTCLFLGMFFYLLAKVAACLWQLGGSEKPLLNHVDVLSGLFALAALCAHALVEFQLHMGAIGLLSVVGLGLTLGALESQLQGPKAEVPSFVLPSLWLKRAMIPLLASALFLSFILPTWPTKPLPIAVERIFRGAAPYEGCATAALARSPSLKKPALRAQRCGNRALILSPISWKGLLGMMSGQARVEGVEAATPAWTRFSTLAATRWEADWQMAFVYLGEGNADAAQPFLRDAIQKSRIGMRPQRIAQLWRQPGSSEFVPALVQAFPEAGFLAAKRLILQDHKKGKEALLALGSKIASIQSGPVWMMQQVGVKKTITTLGGLDRDGLPDGWSDLANIEEALNNSDEKLAHRHALMAIGKGSDWVASLATLMALEGRLGQEQSLADALIQRYGTFPNNKDVRGSLVETLEAAQRWTEAQEILENWVSLEPSRPHLHHQLQEIQDLLGISDHDNHLRLAQRGQSRHPLLAEVYCRCKNKIRDLQRNGGIALHR